MKNKLTDLNDHLFAQLERLSDEELKGEALQTEIARAKAIQGIAGEVINNARVVLDGHKALSDRVLPKLPPMLGHDE